MPEGPEVERLRQQLLPEWIGKALVHIAPGDVVRTAKFFHPTLETFKREVYGKAIADIRRKGKWLEFYQEGDKLLFVLHLGSTGWLLPSPDDTFSKGFDHTLFIHKISREKRRFSLVLSTGSDETGSIWMYCDPRTWGKFTATSESPAATYGPDWITESDAAIQATVAHSERGTRSVKGVLCDQSVAAGLGNILSCESLYRACIHPHTEWKTLDEEQKRTLAACVEGVVRFALKEPARDWWRVFEKKGQLCVRCGQHKIAYQKDQGGSRGSYFCPGCQVKRPFYHEKAES